MSSARYGLSIRPEHVHLVARATDANRLAAVVDRVHFLGAELVVSCRLEAGGRSSRFRFAPTTRRSRLGDRVELGVSATRCRVVVG